MILDSFSFLTRNFGSTSFTHLRNVLRQISSWMTANRLTLNSIKTGFLLIGLEKQLAKYTTPHSTQPTLLATLALSLTNTINQSIDHWFIKTGDKPQPLNTVDNKITTIKRQIMNSPKS